MRDDFEDPARSTVIASAIFVGLVASVITMIVLHRVNTPTVTARAVPAIVEGSR